MKKNLANETIKRAIKDMTKELNLKHYPKVINHVEEEFVMAATGTITYAMKNFCTKVITKTECDYELHINKRAINSMISQYTIGFANKQAAYDCLYLLVCHELRHMWQFQEQFQVGDIMDNFDMTSLFHGHGANKEEKDANDWMLYIAKKKGLEHLACFMECTQRSMGAYNQYDNEFKHTMYTHRMEALKHYNYCMYLLSKTMHI